MSNTMYALMSLSYRPVATPFRSDHRPVKPERSPRASAGGGRGGGAGRGRGRAKERVLRRGAGPCAGAGVTVLRDGFHVLSIASPATGDGEELPHRVLGGH